ncbi:hypothetical protein [Phenylobacterium sp.]|uniref:hypothetical protein n=1 Tax=Phenylobacterium sp. TaxID=1871053 RepID=UPI002BA5B2D1|nr:hypothetical protein [Phenylobacterium sp.]HVI32663.1 hypothetical protein [Phenylobacterium sp.]
MSDRQSQLTTLSRRTVLGAAAAVSALGGKAAEQDILIERAKAWLAIDAEARRLMVRWARLETRAARALDWFNLTDQAQASTLFGVEMARIDRELSLLYARREAEFEALAGLKAQDLAGVASKLAVASRLLAHEDSPAAGIVAGALADMQDLGWSHP